MRGNTDAPAAFTSATRSLQSRTRWALTGLALLVLLVLPSAQIKLGASQLHGLIGSYTSNNFYSVVYSGGTTTINTNTPTNYSANTSASAPGAWGGGDNAYGTDAVSANCAGQITATFTWNPGLNNDPAPPAGSVIVTETASAAWSGPGSTGSCGLPNPTKSATAPNETGTRYSVQGGGSFSVNCTPTASLSGTGPGGGQVIGGSVYVGYMAAANPATIALSGPVLDGSGHYNILVGQGCTASLIPSSNISNYNWSVDGSTFQSWTAGTLSAVLVSGSGPLTNPTAHWYWSDTDAYYNITCTATFTPPVAQGSPAPAPIPLNLVQKVHLRVPTTTENPLVGRGRINNHAPQPDYGAGYALYAGGVTRNDYGIAFPTQVNTPAPFSPGIWNFVQLIQATISTTPAGQLPNAGQGVIGLDTRYPLYPISNSSFPTGVPANNLLDGTGDSPGIPSLQDHVTMYHVSENFSTYVMFLPSGSDTQWVPLWNMGWTFKADDSIPGINPNLSWSAWDDNNSAGAVTLVGSLSTITHPQWRGLGH